VTSEDMRMPPGDLIIVPQGGFAFENRLFFSRRVLPPDTGHLHHRSRARAHGYRAARPRPGRVGRASEAVNPGSGRVDDRPTTSAGDQRALGGNGRLFC
jgi:hypothetical protein